MKKLDFPKGKADEGEPDIECAVREIYEETGKNIRAFIDEQHFVKIEAFPGKFVTLFMARDLDENQFRQ